MQIKALPNGAAAWHGAVPESRAGQRSEGYRSSTQAAAWKLNWNSWVPNTPGADLCEESSARRRPRATVTAQTLKLNLTLDDKQEISHKCDPISSERTIQVHQTWTCSTHTNAVLYLQYSPKCRQTWGRSVRQEAGSIWKSRWQSITQCLLHKPWELEESASSYEQWGFTCSWHKQPKFW